MNAIFTSTSGTPGSGTSTPGTSTSGARSSYVGRFAPSPTGPLHLGSLVAALGSWLDARSVNGTWLLRLEDLDTLRNARDAESTILATLEAHGLSWDHTPMRQSERLPVYAEHLAELRRDDRIYPCCCTRRTLEDSHGPYPGTCRDGMARGRKERSLRLRCPPGFVAMFTDRAFGPRAENVAKVVGDFVVRRADGVVAYQFAVVIDDAAQGVTDVVRGADLLDSTGRQLMLQTALGFSAPRYLHLPVVMGADGQKLSKQNRAAPLDPRTPAANVQEALRYLRQPLPADGLPPLKELLEWALAHWQVPVLRFSEPTGLREGHGA